MASADSHEVQKPEQTAATPSEQGALLHAAAKILEVAANQGSTNPETKPRPLVKCPSCGHEIVVFTPDLYTVGPKEGIPCCPECKTSLLRLFPNDCPACGYFLKRPFGTQAGSPNPTCAKCKSPIVLKSADQILKESENAATMAEDLSPLSDRGLESNERRFPIALAGGALALLAGIVVVAMMTFQSSSNTNSQSTTQIQTADPKVGELQSKLSSTQAELDRLRALQQSQGSNSVLNEQIARQQALLQQQQQNYSQPRNQVTQPNSDSYSQPNNSYAGSQSAPNNAYTQDSSNSENSQPASQKSEADKYLESGSEIKQGKKGN